MDLYNGSQQAVNTGMLIYKQAPWFMDIWFYVGIFLLLGSIGAVLWVYFQHNIKNRTNLRVHFNDKKVRTYSFKNLTSEYVDITYGDKDKNGDLIKHRKHIVVDCIEYGYFGRYLDYDENDTEPLNWKTAIVGKYNFNMRDFSRVTESYLNSETLYMLLLIGKLKDFLISMLWFILIAVIVVGIGLALIAFLNHPTVNASLIADNATITTIKMGCAR